MDRLPGPRKLGPGYFDAPRRPPTVGPPPEEPQAVEHKEITLRMPFDNAGDIIALTFEEMSFVADIAASQVNDSKPEPSRADVLKAVIKLMFSP